MGRRKGDAHGPRRVWGYHTSPVATGLLALFVDERERNLVALAPITNVERMGSPIRLGDGWDHVSVLQVDLSAAIRAD